MENARILFKQETRALDITWRSGETINEDLDMPELQVNEEVINIEQQKDQACVDFH